ncbi:hypothetical protein LWC35_33020 [Pseudonocardia kujensis]|uniref:hypothetical protein n=1 Tax=Pseudonocardia kujensis TaxID=1128675 RepID=UPI001E32318C|nr:hypothetical protein [Pseudonocardia kujensis]MCE0767683.1 hypothetical protein [Pseudonocardia kujensis]
MSATFAAPDAVRTAPDAPSPRGAGLVVAGALLVAHPALRPYGDATVDGMAAAFASPAWLVSHLAAVAGFVLVGLGIRPLSRAAAAMWWIGAGLVLPYYGAEAFALHALGLHSSGAALAAAADAVRNGPVQLTAFGAGLLLFAASAVLVAVRGRALALPFALAMVLFLPQFFLPPALRIAHGVLLGVGCVLLAAAVHRRAG